MKIPKKRKQNLQVLITNFKKNLYNEKFANSCEHFRSVFKNNYSSQIPPKRFYNLRDSTEVCSITFFFSFLFKICCFALYHLLQNKFHADKIKRKYMYIISKGYRKSFDIPRYTLSTFYHIESFYNMSVTELIWIKLETGIVYLYR